MRHGMRSYTMGQAWWVGDCGPFWGHNALVRIKPFHEQCELPMLPGKPPLGGHVLSHDQVEATLMRRAGYEVRVLPEERGSWEENPPTMLEFAQRDVRWCQGNMQYLKLLDLPGLYPMSRFQLVWAILMFIGIPAWTLMIALLPVAAWQAQGIADFPVDLAIGLYVTFFTMYLMPKIAGLARRRADARRRGALRRLAAVRAGRGHRARVLVPAGRRLHHPHLDLHDRPAVREVGGVGRAVARRAAACPGRTRRATCGRRRCSASSCAARCCLIAPAVFWWSLPLTAGYLLAIPFAVLTADPALRPRPAAARPVRHPRGLRHAGRGEGGDAEGRRR